MLTTPIDPSGPQVKGAAIREFMLWYERRDPGAPGRLMSDLPPELARLLDPTRPAFGVLASTWYPAAICHHFLDRIVQGLPDEGRALAREVNREVVPRMIHGIYKVIYRAVASPELYSRHIGRQWRRLHTTGERSFVVRAPGEGLSLVTDWPAHHTFLCWITIYTMVSLFESMGFGEVTAERIHCVGHGAKECATVLRWR